MQHVRAHRHELFAGLKTGAHRSGLFAEAGDHHRAPDGGRFAGFGIGVLNDPDTRARTTVGQGTQGDLQGCDALRLGDLQRHGGTKRRLGSGPVERVAGVEGARYRIGRFGKLAKPGWHRLTLDAVDSRRRARTQRRSQGFRQVDPGFPRTGVCQFDDHLPGGNHLPRFDQRIDDGAVSVGHEYGVSRLVSCHLGLGHGCA